MKNPFFNYTLLCMITMLIIPACENAEIHSGRETQSPITSRGDCDDCPDMDQCCCYVEIDPNDNNNSATIEICGTDATGGPTCTGSAGSCLSTNWNSGYISPVTLTSPTNPRVDFCMELGTAFFIRNTHATDEAKVKVSCQRGQASPQIISLTIAAGVRNIQKADTGCNLTDCN